jgi:hypothetical protein
VGSYPTVSPLPAKAPLKDDEQVPLPPVTAANFRGGLFSVALSVNLQHKTPALPAPLALPGALPIYLLTQTGVRTFLPSRLLRTSDHPAHPLTPLYRDMRQNFALVALTLRVLQIPRYKRSPSKRFPR